MENEQSIGLDTSTPEFQGAFFDNLNRNNKKIKSDRAIAITEAAQIRYKRKIEDMEMELKKISRERAGMLDLSPTHADSLVLATDFDEVGFVNKDIDLGVQARNLRIQLEIAKESYKYLFGE